MKRFSHTLQSRWVWNCSRLALPGLLILAGLTLKPAPMTEAGVPKVLADGDPNQLQATASARVTQRQEQVRQIRPENFDLNRFPVVNQHERHWRNILWTTAVVEPKEAFVAEALDQILAMMTGSGWTTSQLRTIDMATKVGTQLYLSAPLVYNQVGERFRNAVERGTDPEWVAVSLSGLAKAGIAPNELRNLVETVKKRFPGWTRNPHLYTTLLDLTTPETAESFPPLPDLLNWMVVPRQLHLYVLCRPDREILCQAVLKDRNGEFVRQGGQLWSVPLLLRSIHGLRWNFIRGQTPQGIFRVEGVVPQPDDEFFRAYGQFSLVNLFAPLEDGAKQFLPGRAGAFTGNLTTYQNLLPPSWRSYFPIQQSYWAGKIGRSEFRIHGTGEAPDFFSGKMENPDAYNWNPTIGCLSALELYNEQGQLIQADMPKILNALQMVGGKNFAGYLIVVNVPGEAKAPVSLAEIETAIGRPIRASKKSKPFPKAPASKKVAVGLDSTFPQASPVAFSAEGTASTPTPVTPPSTRPVPVAY
jgi:hypothetical protein